MIRSLLLNPAEFYGPLAPVYGFGLFLGIYSMCRTNTVTTTKLLALYFWPFVFLLYLVIRFIKALNEVQP